MHFVYILKFRDRNKPKNILITIGIAIILILLSTNAAGYETKGDRSLDANCLAYSKEVRDELTTQGKDAHIIGFQHGKKQGHAMVVINAFTPDWRIIESYTGQEFTAEEPHAHKLEGYLAELIGGYPEKVWIFD